jgi:preprotein translocase subunit SecE
MSRDEVMSLVWSVRQRMLSAFFLVFSYVFVI